MSEPNQLPGMEGTEVAQEIRRRGLPVRVLALSAYDDERYLQGMLEAGAVGYLLKDEAPEVIVQAIRKAARGELYLSTPVALEVAEGRMGRGPGGLTPREVDVLRLVARGLTNKEITARLGVKERTVEFHLTNILRKLGTASRVEAAVWAKERGLV